MMTAFLIVCAAVAVLYLILRVKKPRNGRSNRGGGDGDFDITDIFDDA